jgi:hypothetical protein
MFRQLLFVFPIIWSCIGSTTVFAQVSPDVLERGKRATALVEVVTDKGQATGSAFCIDKTGLFVTNAHVIGGAGVGDRIQLVLDIGRKTQRSVRAVPLWINEELDLALLKAQATGGPLISLGLGKDGDVKLGDEVTAFGFPFGPAIALPERGYSEVSVNLSKVKSLGRDKDALYTIKFDGQLNPGNSGGPVMGPNGKVVGVAVATVAGGGINFAIPVGQLSRALSTPALQFNMPPVPLADRYRPVTWNFKVIPPWPSGTTPDGLSVAVTLEDDRGDPRTFAAHPSGNGVYRVTITPDPCGPDREVVLQVRTGNRPQDVAQVEMKDRDVMVGRHRIRLGDLRMISFNPGDDKGPYVMPAGGGGIEGPIKGLGPVDANVNGKKVKIDLTRTQRIDVQGYSDPGASVRMIQVVAELRNGAETLSACHRTLDFTIVQGITARTVEGDFITFAREPLFRWQPRLLNDDGLVTIGGSLQAMRSRAVPAREPGMSRHQGELLDAQTTHVDRALQGEIVQRLEGNVSDVIAGGGGRYLLLVLKDVRKLAVFDVNVPGVVKTIPLASEKVLVAAGARKFVIAFPEESLLQRWDFETLASEGGFRPSPIKGELKALAMGSGSDGPILAMWAPGKPHGAHQHFSFVDLASLEVLRIGPIHGTWSEVSLSRGSFNVGGYGWDVRASPGGRLFGFVRREAPSGFVTSSVRDGNLRLYGGEKIFFPDRHGFWGMATGVLT